MPEITQQVGLEPKTLIWKFTSYCTTLPFFFFFGFYFFFPKPFYCGKIHIELPS